MPKKLFKKVRKKGVKVVLSDENKAPSFTIKNSLFLNNKAKQYLSFLAGINEIKDKLTDVFIVKIRSDITLNLDRMLREIKNKNADLIFQYFCAFSLKCKIPYAYLPDFWFAGKGEILKDIFENLYIDSISDAALQKTLAHYDIALGIISYYHPNTRLLTDKLKKMFPEKSLKEYIIKFFSSFKYVYLKKIMSNLIFHFIQLYFILKFNRLILRKKILTCSKDVEYSIIWRGGPTNKIQKIFGY